jgi:hypothetical protein
VVRARTHRRIHRQNGGHSGNLRKTV